MYIRIQRQKRKNGKVVEYIQLVKSIRKGKKVTQKHIATLGRLDKLTEKGQLEKLSESLLRALNYAHIIDLKKAKFKSHTREYGPVLIWRRVWKEWKLGELLRRIQDERKVTFDLSASVFAMVLNRLMEPDSKVGCFKWMCGVEAPEFRGIALEHLYRALDYLWERKEEIEGYLYSRGRDLFSREPQLVFLDTTTSLFWGSGPEGLARYGYSKAKRSDLKEMVIGLLMSGEGMPLSVEVFPGNFSDKLAIEPFLSQMRDRFGVRRVILVCDWGMVSGSNLEILEGAGYEYIVGLPLRGRKDSEEVLSMGGRFRRVPRERGGKVEDGVLYVKSISLMGRRYVLCYSPERAKEEKEDRVRILEKLGEYLGRYGSKGLADNRGFRRYVRTVSGVFEVDWEKVRREARYDGKYLLLTNNRDMSTEEIAWAYRELWRVERGFRELKSSLEIDPTYHWTARRVKAHVFVCFLALLMEAGLKMRFKEFGLLGDYSGAMEALKRVRVVRIEHKGKVFRVRDDIEGSSFLPFKVLGLKPPPKVVEVSSGV